MNEKGGDPMYNTNYPSWRTDPALYSARCERIRRRKERRLDRLANAVLDAAIGFLSAVVFLLALC